MVDNRRHHTILHPSDQENPNQNPKDDPQIEVSKGSQQTEKRELEDGNCNSTNREGSSACRACEGEKKEWEQSY